MKARTIFMKRRLWQSPPPGIEILMGFVQRVDDGETKMSALLFHPCESSSLNQSVHNETGGHNEADHQPFSTMVVDDDGFQVNSKKTKVKVKKVVLSNLLNNDSIDLNDRIRTAVAKKLQMKDISGISVESLSGTDNRKSVTVAIKSSLSLENLLRGLRGLKINGRALTVHKERRGNSNKPSFASSDWEKPSVVLPQSVKEVEEVVAPVVASAMEEGDPVTNTIVSAAATSLFVSLCNVPTDGSNGDEDEPEKQEAPVSNSLPIIAPTLSALLADYGEQDPNWQQVQPTTAPATTAVQPTTPQPTESRLGQHGKAPIHVQVTSFGFRHGVPADLKSASTGNSYSHPLSVFDVRDLAPVPRYLAWMDGTSGAVRTALIRETNAAGQDLFATAREIASAVIQAVQVSIDGGGHGYAAPLRTSIFIGSENGRHRSVVVAEQVGRSIRKLLRENADDRIRCPVSVGCLHTHAERGDSKSSGSIQRKQHALDTDDA